VLEVRRLDVLQPGEPLTARQGASGTTALDAVQVQPLVETLTLRGGGGAQALLRSFGSRPRVGAVELPGSGKATAAAYDARGRLAGRARTRGPRIEITIPPGGFAIAER
jgi:YD repeat-containing protein